ncbi:hypothetical protein CEE34_09250 [Candidatus Aerophobetes bacterium Ae_b3a]|nr:MAG: hypothetical protein CEE34_09250 [Candidatus Aerophobetes bacterium Ae_b3a]
MDLKKDFLNPEKDCRSAPFWSWNDKLSPNELVRQVKGMKEHGMGGFFMHSREGLETDYLGKEWMKCIKAVVEVSRKVGMNAWLYDEDRWPSGFAGGRVPSQGDKYRAKALGMEKVTKERKLSGEELASFCIKLKNGKITELRKVKEKDKLLPGENEIGLVFTREVAKPSEWFNNDAYSDNLNPDAVKAFINSTYEAYKEEVGDEFGKTIPGIFTDEPNFSSGTFRQGIEWIPWTDGFAEYFKEICGYNFLEVVPYFFFDAEKSKKVRHDYWLALTRRFQEAYSRQLGKWCEKNNLLFTGHYLSENDFPGQIKTVGAAMPHYVYQHVPGIDILTESIYETLTVKQCSSVANQFKRNTVLSETYGCSGWEFTFEGQKWVGDWQYALGVTLRCQHLTLYTLKGCRKRDFPPSFNYNTTWWKYNRVVEDYFARLSSLLTKGKAKRDVLLIHPISGAWSLFNGKNSHEVQKISDEFQAIAGGILTLHYDYDLGDELILKDYGKVEGEKFFVNRAQYKVIILPPMRNVESSTVKLLEDFLKQGGKVFVIGPLPDTVDGQKSQECKRLSKYEGLIEVENLSKLAPLLEQNLEREISIKEKNALQAPSFIYIEREIDGKKIFFVVNLDKEKGHKVDISFKSQGRLEEWNALTGEISGIPARKDNGYLTISASFGPAGSRLYVIDPKREAAIEAPFDKDELLAMEWQKPSGVAFVGPYTQFKRTDPNILTLDRASYCFSGENWSKEMPIWKAQKEIREKLAMRPIHINGIPQRYLWCKKPHANDGKPLSFRIIFSVDDIPKDSVYLVLEEAQDFDIRLNNQAVSSQPIGWYLDRSFDKIPLPVLREGMNDLILSCEYKNRMEVEDCFLVGDFGIDIHTRRITKEPDRLHFGDWTSQGYPHYAGGIIYQEKVNIKKGKGDRFLVKLGDFSAIAVSIWVNDALAGHIPWPDAGGLEITDVLKNGENMIGIEITASPRNMLGPLHRKAGYEPWTDSRSFRTEAHEWTDEYVVWPWGLYGQVRICKFAKLS